MKLKKLEEEKKARQQSTRQRNFLHPFPDNEIRVCEYFYLFNNSNCCEF